MADELARGALQNAREYSLAMETYRQVICRLAHLRRDALRDARRQGLSVIAIARHLGISRQQVHRLLREGGDAAAWDAECAEFGCCART